MAVHHFPNGFSPWLSRSTATSNSLPRHFFGLLKTIHWWGFLTMINHYPYANHGAGIFTYITGWFCSGKCWDSYSSTMEHLGYWSLWTIVNHGSSIYYWRIGFGGLGKLEGSCLDVELSAQMSSSHDGLSPTWHPDNEHDECCFQPSNLVVLAYVDKPMLDIFGFIYIYIWANNNNSLK